MRFLLALIFVFSSALSFAGELKDAKHGLAFCQKPNLVEVIFYFPSAVAENCAYVIPPGFLKVLQAVPGGVLAVGTATDEYTIGKAIFIRTTKDFADGDPIGGILVRSSGTFRYSSALGAAKTVRSFQFLEDVSKTSTSKLDPVSPKGPAPKPASCQDACFKKADEHQFKAGETFEDCLRNSCK